MTIQKQGRRMKVVVGLAVLATAVAGCSSTGGRPDTSSGSLAGGSANTPRATIAMITHEAPGDSFWDLVRRGAETAAAKDNIELRYSSDPQGPNQATLIQSALDSDVDGIAITLAKPEAMTAAIQSAVDRGTPVVGFNAGLDNWQDLGMQGYFGQDENIAGQAAGERLNDEGAQRVLCVIQEQGHVALEARCAGVAATFRGNVEILNVNGTDMPSVQSTITAKLQQDPSIDRIMTLGAPFALTAVQSADNAGSEAQVVTFDTNAALVGAIQSGDVLWAVDQQPFLQGYLAVDALWLYINNGNSIGGGQPVLTGPAFIDQSNIDEVAEYAEAGRR